MSESGQPAQVGSNAGLGLAPEQEAATWYEVNRYGTPTIRPVRVRRETEHQIVLADCHPGNARRAKAGTYFPTWAEAHQYLMRMTQRDLDAARQALAIAQGRHGNVKGMRPNARIQPGPTAQEKDR